MPADLWGAWHVALYLPCVGILLVVGKLQEVYGLWFKDGLHYVLKPAEQLVVALPAEAVI